MADHIPHSYREWLRTQCGVIRNEAHWLQVPNQPPFIVVGPENQPIGTATHIDAAQTVIDLFLDRQLLHMGREPGDYLDDPEVGG